jgi:GDP-L-fucose synthase
MADACVHIMGLPESTYWSAVQPQVSHINVGSGKDIAIAELARLIAEVCGFAGSIQFNDSMPDGTPRKLLDVSRLTSLGWSPRIDLGSGIRSTLQWMIDNLQEAA